jgi:dihydrofolate reductase
MLATVFIATSLDGYIAREDGGIDWLPANPEPHGYDEFIASVDAIVIGRKTFETVLAFGGWAYGKTPVVVLSTRELRAPEGANCDFMSGDPRAIVAALEQRGIKHIYVDGGITIQRFLEAGLIQRMIITRIPLLLGSGIPLFGPLSRDVRLEHVTTRFYPSGLVQSEYTFPDTASAAGESAPLVSG